MSFSSALAMCTYDGQLWTDVVDSHIPSAGAEPLPAHLRLSVSAPEKCSKQDSSQGVIINQTAELYNGYNNRINALSL
jgi:hypothetical protein